MYVIVIVLYYYSNLAARLKVDPCGTPFYVNANLLLYNLFTHNKHQYYVQIRKHLILHIMWNFYSDYLALTDRLHELIVVDRPCVRNLKPKPNNICNMYTKWLIRHINGNIHYLTYLQAGVGYTSNTQTVLV